MKTKRIRKALEMKKETIVNLESHELNSAVGGRTAYSVCDCPIIIVNFNTDEFECTYIDC